ncbi:MAG: MarC family protein [Acidiferrobacterales bacterium]|nr:MarC family protein [Acidiferrobacterales bacterium]
MEILINSFVVLFVVIDPIGVALIFYTLTHNIDIRQQRRTALRGVTLATVILLVFFLIGDILLRRLGISIPAMRIAGGSLLFLLAIDMILVRQSGLRSTTRREQQEAEHKEDVSVFPLAFPLIAGPGALTTVLLMASSSPRPVIFAGMIVVLLLVLATTLLSLFFASNMMRILGETGTNVISRLLGLILAALAVQYVIDGIKASFFDQTV